jgi:hypothetical protein
MLLYGAAALTKIGVCPMPLSETSSECFFFRDHFWAYSLCQSSGPVPTVPVYPEPILLAYHAAALVYVTGCLHGERDTHAHLKGERRLGPI